MNINRTINASRLSPGDAIEVMTQPEFGPKVRRLKYFVPPFHYSHISLSERPTGTGPSTWIGLQHVTLYKTGEKVVYGSS